MHSHIACDQARYGCGSVSSQNKDDSQWLTAVAITSVVPVILCGGTCTRL